MINLFDPSNYPKIEPLKLSVGSFWAWRRDDISSAYPTDAYTLKYAFYLQSNVETRFDFTASDVNGFHVVALSKDDTTAYKAGDYTYQIIVIRHSDSQEIVIGDGVCTLSPDLSVGSGDVRSHARKVLDAIRANIEKTATKDQQSYSIAGRSLSRRSIDELTALEKEYTRRVAKEKNDVLRKQGRAKKNSVLVKLGA